MPLEKQSLNNFLPDGFETLNQEGYKTNFSEDKIKTGYEKDIKDRVSGPNLNNLIDVVGKNTNTLNNYVEYLNGMPINNVPTTDENGQLNYINLDDKLTKKQITNCILEIPQRIKLELNNGTLTLKAGSKVIVPNGFEADGTTPKCQHLTIENDLTYQAQGVGTSTYYLFYTPSVNALNGGYIGNAVSSTTIPSGVDSLVYRTDENTLAFYRMGTLENYRSFPLAKFSIENGVITKILEIYNGTGDFASTIWADKDIKGLVSIGKNLDGSIKNREVYTDRVYIGTRTSFGQGAEELLYVLNFENKGVTFSNSFIEVDTFSDFQNSSLTSTFFFIKTLGLLYYRNADKSYRKVEAELVLGKVSIDENIKVSELRPKQPFRAVDYSDSSTVSGWGMPSDRYIDLTFGVTETQYTAPVNGWFFARVVVNSRGNVGLVSMNSGLIDTKTAPNFDGVYLDVNIEVKKGDTIKIQHYNVTSTQFFRFIYAEGEQ